MTERPNYGAYDPRTMWVPRADRATALPARCCGCGDVCTGNLLLPVDETGGVRYTDQFGGTLIITGPKGPACKMCMAAYVKDGDMGVREWVESTAREQMLARREGVKHRGVGYHRVIAEQSIHRMTTETTFAQRWELANRQDDILHRLMWLPCTKGDRGARDHSGALGGILYNRYALEGGLLERDRVVAATAIQWLGTNVGLSWLIETLNVAGYVVKDRVLPEFRSAFTTVEDAPE